MFIYKSKVRVLFGHWIFLKRFQNERTKNHNKKNYEYFQTDVQILRSVWKRYYIVCLNLKPRLGYSKDQVKKRKLLQSIVFTTTYATVPLVETSLTFLRRSTATRGFTRHKKSWELKPTLNTTSSIKVCDASSHPTFFLVVTLYLNEFENHLYVILI